MKLHRNGTNWNRDERNKTNDNWDEIEGNYNNIVENVSEKAFDKVVDASKLNWKDIVNTFEDLPSNAVVGDTRAVRENGYIYRYDGSQWKIIQEFDLSMIDDLGTTMERYSEYVGVSQKQIHKKEIVLELPGRFADYNRVMVGQEGYMHPQSFTVLEQDNLLFVLYVPESSGMTTRWIAIYDWRTGKYLGCFGLRSKAWEGIVVKYENNKRSLYVADENESGSYDMDKYDITELPTNMSVLSPYDSISLDIEHRFGYHDGNWIVMKRYDSGNKSYISRALWQILDEDFKVIKNIRVSGRMRSLVNRSNALLFPKMQGLAIGSNFIVVGIGPYADRISAKHKQQGVILLDYDGNIITEGVYDNAKLFDRFQGLDFNPYKVENEGVWVDSQDNIYSISVLNSNDSEKGIIIMQEGANTRNVIDFSGISTPLHSLNVDKYGDRYFPSYDGYFRNPINQTIFTNINEMLDFVVEFDLPAINIYVSSDITLNGFDGKPITKTTSFHFINLNSLTLYGQEISFNGIRNMFYARGNVVQLPSSHSEELIDSPITISKGKKISLKNDINKYKEIKIVYQLNGLDNRVHTFSTDRTGFDIRDFNMSDSLSSEAISFAEVRLDRGDTDRELTISKCINQLNVGIDSVKKNEISELSNDRIMKIIGVY